MADELVPTNTTDESADTRQMTTLRTAPARPGAALIPQNIEEVWTLAKIFANSKMYQSDKGVLSADECMVILLTGQDMGLTASQAMRGIPVVKGRPSPYAAALVGACKARPDICKYLRTVKSTADECIIETWRVGDPDPTQMSFSMKDAERAGLTKRNPTYFTYPADMLYSKCANRICNRVYADITMGLSTPEEVRYEIDPATGDMSVEPEAAPAPTKAEQVREKLAEKKTEKAARETVPAQETPPVATTKPPVAVADKEQAKSQPKPRTAEEEANQKAHSALTDKLKAMDKEERQMWLDQCQSRFGQRNVLMLSIAQTVEIYEAIDAKAEAEKGASNPNPAEDTVVDAEYADAEHVQQESTDGESDAATDAEQIDDPFKDESGDTAHVALTGKDRCEVCQTPIGNFWAEKCKAAGWPPLCAIHGKEKASPK